MGSPIRILEILGRGGGGISRSAIRAAEVAVRRCPSRFERSSRSARAVGARLGRISRTPIGVARGPAARRSLCPRSATSNGPAPAAIAAPARRSSVSSSGSWLSGIAARNRPRSRSRSPHSAATRSGSSPEASSRQPPTPRPLSPATPRRSTSGSNRPCRSRSPGRPGATSDPFGSRPAHARMRSRVGSPRSSSGACSTWGADERRLLRSARNHPRRLLLPAS
jgi:hypothetical protein